MSRRNLTANKRSFRRNPQSFLDKVTKLPINIEIDDGVNPAYTIKVDPVSAKILNSDDVPVTTTTSRFGTPEGDREEF